MFKCLDQELSSELKELLLKTLLLQMVDGDDHTFSTGSFMRMEEDGEEFVRTEPAIVQANDRFEESVFVCVAKKPINKTGMLWKRIKGERNGKTRTKNKAILQGVKFRLIQAPMRLNFLLWRPNPENWFF